MPALPVEIAVGLALAGSLVVWTVVIARWYRGQPILSAQEPRWPAWSRVALGLTLGWLAVNLVSRLALGVEAEQALEQPLQFVQAQVTVQIVLFVVLLLPLAYASPHGLRDFGFQVNGWPVQLGIGGLTFLASVLPVLALMLATLEWRQQPDAQHPLLKLLADDPDLATVAWVALAAVVLAPLVEELMYRVILQGTFERLVPPWAAIVGVALVFSAVHNPVDFLPLVPLALILGYTYHRTRSYLAVVTAHALFNLANLLLMLAAPDVNGAGQPVPPGPPAP